MLAFLFALHDQQSQSKSQSPESSTSSPTQSPSQSPSAERRLAALLTASNHTLYVPKVICVLSRMPFYRAMRRYLRQLYAISLSAARLPLETFVSSVVAQIPLPVEGGRPFHVILDAALIAPTSKPMASIHLELPEAHAFPFLDLDFSAPLRGLSVEHLLALFVLLLRESKLVFVSTSNALLTETMETLRHLLFPLHWASTFVSRLPAVLSDILLAPGGSHGGHPPHS